MKIKRVLLALIIILSGCGKNSPDADKPGQKPANLLLKAPLQNEVCVNGAVISDTTSAISFSWVAVANAASYELYISNLLNNQVIKQTLNGTTFTASLKRNTPYSWQVIAKGTTDALSDKWKFYVAGLPATLYAPFPAELVSPLQGESMVTNYPVTLYWKGSSVSGNIAGFDVYFGTAINPPLFKGDLSSTSTSYTVTADHGNTYYWRVVTKDTNGNTSTSALFQFNSR